MWRSGVEDSLGRARAVAAWMHLQYVAVGAIEPGQDEELVAGTEALESRENFCVEHEDRVGGSFVALQRCGFEIGQGRLDVSNRSCFESLLRHQADARTSRVKLLLGIAMVFAVACGAKSELGVPDPDDERSAGGGGSSAGERSCLPNCTVGHLCCAGSCDGPAVQTRNDCCECLPGEVNSSACPGASCGR